MSKYSVEQKLDVLRKFEDGIGYAATATMLGFPKAIVKVWHLQYRGGRNDWVTSNCVQMDIRLLEQAVLDYVSTEKGFTRLSAEYGIARYTIRKGYQNYLKYGSVRTPRSRAMKNLNQTKQELREKLDNLDSNVHLDEKSLKEMRDLLIVNLALLDVILETDCGEIKKKELRQQKEQLNQKLAYVRRVLS